MARLLQIAQLGHSVLRQTAAPVADPGSPAVEALIADMMATVGDASGVGIAAPQVYESSRIFIMASRPNARYPHAPEMPATALINPEILDRSDRTERDWEGCLSIPGLRARVPRAVQVQVRYTGIDGTEKTTVFDDFLARVFQHELDHLDGKVYLDRVETSLDIVTEKEFWKILNRGA